ncbi:MAG: hypothetical protein KIT84_24035 [Labilithrix sp.]|nr:hypothetical protein [Labilithrix sp.]MCW5814120.1 hypothetical protein [Labilithrix sp.]
MRSLGGRIEARTFYFFALVIASFAVACSSLLDFDQFEVGALDDAGSNVTDTGSPDGGDTPDASDTDDGGCFDPAGFGGRGCWRCAPTNQDEILNACTASDFVPFDNAARIAGYDPNTPQPPLVDGGPTPPPFDAGAPPPPVDDAGPAPTAAPCPLNLPNPVMILGATGFPMDVIAKAMGSAAPGAGATMYYSEKSSCVGVASRILNTPKLSGEIVYYDSAGTARKCTLEEEHPADINLSALFADSCAGQEGLSQNVQLPPDVQDLLGPVNPIMLATPKTSTELVISAEAAYKVYGFGAASGVAPWTDELYIFRRTASSANQQTVARSLGLPIGGLRGRDSSGSSNMKNALQFSDNPVKTIGISASEIVDINRDVMKALAFQHFGQKVGFYPDSSPGAFNRRNVRDGHYFLWIPLHVLVRTVAGDPVAAQNLVLEANGATATARNAAVKLLAYVMVNRQEAPVKSVDLFGALKVVGNVPQCAMRVTRAKEGAPLTPFEPSLRCDCAFEAASPGETPAGCQSCTESSTCPASRPTCSFGYCE